MFGGLKPSKSSLDRLPKQLGQRWERERIEFEDVLRAQVLFITLIRNPPR